MHSLVSTRRSNGICLRGVIGLLGGGVGGAVGAAAGATLVPVLGEEIAGMNLPEPVRQGLTQVVGSAVGGVAGGTTALNQTAHNYVSHRCETLRR